MARTGSTRAQGLGVLRGTALYVAAIVGPGILTLPAIAAHNAGPASLVALAALLLVSVPIAFTFVAIERTSPGAGGVAAYATRAFGATTGRIVGYWFHLGVPIGVPALGLIGGGYLADATGGGKVTAAATAAAVVLVAIAANLGRRAGSGRLTPVLTALLAALVVVTAAVALPHGDSAPLTPFAPRGWAAIGSAALVLTWVLTGWEAVSHFTGRLRDPRRTLPRVTAWALLTVALLYAAVAVPEILVLGPFAGSSEAPLTDMLAVALGQGTAAVAAALAVVIALNNAIAYVASLRDLGTALRESSATGRRPRAPVLLWPSLIMLGGLAAAAVTPLGTEELVAVCVGSQIPVYVLGLAAGLRLLRRYSLPWWLALFSTGAVATLLVPAGLCLLVPAAIAVGVVLRRRPHERRPTQGPVPGSGSGSGERRAV
ncbi:APC family permease [Streptomyces sp. NPDC059894]|uniref:APC family permease n=1 Tax=unclassified Streptomyces TaxID=2593676 RepID=UPI0036463524